MNCAFDKEKLTGYYDGELDAAEKAEVERHIASCSECLRELGELKSAAILVKELPRLRAPRSIAEGVSREIQTAGKVHQFAKVRRTLLWASAAAAVLFVGLNVMYFRESRKEASEAPAVAAAPTAPPPMGKIQQQTAQEEVRKQLADKEEVESRRAVAPERSAGEDEKRLRAAERKNVPAPLEQKELQARDDAAKKAEAPADRAREKDKAMDGLAGGKADAKPGAPPASAAPKPTAAPEPAAPVAKSAPAPAPEPAEKAPPKKEAENLARLESKRGAAEHGAEAAPTHLTLASTQIAKARPQVEDALRKIGVPPPPPPAPSRNLKAAASPREAETTIALELTDSQIARLAKELDKPGTSKLHFAAPGDPVMAAYREGGIFGNNKKDNSGAAPPVVAGGGAGQGAKAKEATKAEGKGESKDAKESKDADLPGRPLTEGAPADKAGAEPRRRIVLHLLEVPFVPTDLPATDALKK